MCDCTDHKDEIPAYDAQAIESRWMKAWEDSNLFAVDTDDSKPKKYVLEMFPYPSGDIHMGHVRNYTIGDVIARYSKMRGFDVLHPMGWDAFGLPAENAAIKHHSHPAKWTYANIETQKASFKRMGLSYDWDRTVVACDPEYYRWGQWIFLQFWKRGLVERRESPVNWCPNCKTVLANEQVTEGECWRCHGAVEKRDLTQWYLKITDYAQELLDDLDQLEGWPERVKQQQSNWIGRSEGAEVDFVLCDKDGNVPAEPAEDDIITVFTTRADTLFGATYMVISPEHPCIEKWADKITNLDAVREYQEAAAKKSDFERTDPNKDKTVQLTGNIEYNYNEANSGNIADSTVNLNLSDANSFWTGNAVLSNGGASNSSSDTVTGLNLSLSNGGTWIVANTATATSSESGSSTTPLAINNLSLNNGTVTFSDASQTATIDNLTGTGGTVNTAVEKNADGTYKTSSLSATTVSTTSGTPTLTVNMVGPNGTTVNSDVISASELAALTSAAVTGALATETTRVATVAEGDVNGALTITENTDGTTTVAAPVRNTKLDSLQSIGAISMTLLRHDLNNLTKRMGELRDAPKGVGAWARVYGSKLSYGDNGLTSKNNSVQVGVDTDIAQTGWKVGGAFIYTNGKADYTGGDGDMDAYSIAAYGTWFGSNGVYVDLIGKYTRMSTDYEFGNMKGGYDNNAFTVSAETGWHKDLGQYAFVEPQAELTYGTVGGADDTASNGVKIDQSDYNSLIARIGVRAGAKFAENKGRIYARVSGNYDFLGDLKMSAQNASARSNLKDDLGGFWVEYGVGANFSFTKNTYGYVDFERTSGGEVDERYRWNVGIRHTF